MIARFAAWIDKVNTTSLRIVVSIGAVTTNITGINVAILLGWEPTPMQLKVLLGEAGVFLTMMGFDVAQFASKRFTDAGYAAAKNPSQPVQTDVPSPAPATDGPVAPTPTPDAGRDGQPKLAGE